MKNESDIDFMEERIVDVALMLEQLITAQYSKLWFGELIQLHFH